jgi:hypothetical protein
METETREHSARKQGDAAPIPWKYQEEKAKQPEKEVVAMNRLSLVLLLLAMPAFGQDANQDDMKGCPVHAEHVAQSHQAVVEAHGDSAMGFPHDKTTHHFRLTADGGAVEVNANDPSDKANTQAIRSHLSRIAMMFSDGDFSTPMFIHEGVPPGVTTMKLTKPAIHYNYQEMPSGGTVWMKSDDPIAVAAIHDFLRFQIKEHQTGDSLEVPTR